MSTDQKIKYQLQKQDEPQMRKKGGLITMPFIIGTLYMYVYVCVC